LLKQLRKKLHGLRRAQTIQETAEREQQIGEIEYEIADMLEEA